MGRRFLAPAVTIVAFLLLLPSCRSISIQEEMQIPESPVQEETEKPDTPSEPPAQSVAIDKPSVIQENLFKVGSPGPHGGFVFECDGAFLEIGEPIYEVSSFEESMALIATMATESGINYVVPTIEELRAIYEQLIITELAEDVEWTYYWSCEEVDEKSSKVFNFDNGFEGVFYKSMEFLSVIPVVRLT